MRKRLSRAALVAVVVTMAATTAAAADVPTRVPAPSPMAPPQKLVLRDRARDVSAGDLDIRSVRVSRADRYCGGPCPGPADGFLGFTLTLAEPVRDNAVYSLMVTEGGKRLEIAAKRAAGVDSFFVVGSRADKNVRRFVNGFISGRTVTVSSNSLGTGINFFGPFRFAATARATNGRHAGFDRAPDGQRTIAFQPH
jgi:hypothetical protein